MFSIVLENGSRTQDQVFYIASDTIYSNHPSTNHSNYLIASSIESAHIATDYLKEAVKLYNKQQMTGDSCKAFFTLANCILCNSVIEYNILSMYSILLSITIPNRRG